MGRGGHGDLVGNRPQEPHQLTGHGHDDLVGLVAVCQPASGAFAPSSVGLPADVLERVGWLFQAALEMSADWGGIAVRPGPFHGDQPQEVQALSGMSDARQVAEFRSRGDGPSQLAPTPGLEGLDDGLYPPRFDLFVAVLFPPLESLAVCGARSDVCLADALLRGGGDRRRPSAS